MIGLASVSCKQGADVDSGGAHGSVSTGGVGEIDATLEAHRGEWVLVNIWATWCKPCVAETPDLIALDHDLRGQPFVLVALSMEFMVSPTESEALEKIKTFTAAHGVGYPNILYTGSTDEIASRFGLTAGIPVSILLDPEGVERKRWVGMLLPENLAQIKDLVGTA